jgi:hypothetical protein
MGSAVNNETDTQQFMFCDNAFVLVLCWIWIFCFDNPHI